MNTKQSISASFNGDSSADLSANPVVALLIQSQRQSDALLAELGKLREAYHANNVLLRDKSENSGAGGISSPPKPLFSEIAEQYLDDRTGSGFLTREKSRIEYRGIFSRFVAFVGDRPIDSYTRKDLMAYRDYLRQFQTLYGIKQKLKQKEKRI